MYIPAAIGRAMAEAKFRDERRDCAPSLRALGASTLRRLPAPTRRPQTHLRSRSSWAPRRGF